MKRILSVLLLCISASGAQRASLTPTSIAWGFELVNQPSADEYVTLWNSGDSLLTITSITFTGVNAAYFSQTNTCGTTLRVNQICRIKVTFNPTGAGIDSAALSIADDSAGSPHTVALSGTGYTITGATRKISPTGNDANDCVTQPCLTPNHMNAALVAGDQLLFGNGTYYLPAIQANVPWGVTVSGTTTAPIVFKADVGASPIITDLMQINSVTTGCGVLTVGCITVTWTPSPNDPIFPKCLTTNSPPCTVNKAMLPSSIINFENGYYKTLGGIINRRTRPNVNKRFAMPQNGDATMCKAAASQSLANIAFGCPGAGINGLQCASQTAPCTGATPWSGAFHQFEFTTGDLIPTSHNMAIGDIQILPFADWSMERYILSTVTLGTPNVATITGATAPSGTSQLSGFMINHDYNVQNRREDLAAGDWYLDRCPTNPNCVAPESQWQLVLGTTTGENPNTDTFYAPQMGGGTTRCGSSLLMDTTGVGALVFQGLTFEGGNWCPDQFGFPDSQGMPLLPDTVRFTNVDNVNWNSATPTSLGNQIFHTSAWGMGIHGKSRSWYINSTAFYDTGGGPFHVGEIGQNTDVCSGGGQTIPSSITFTNNASAEGGRVQPTGEGPCLYIGNVRNSTFQHNDVYGCYGGGINFGHMLNVGAAGGTTASCFCGNKSLWNHVYGEGLNGQFVGLLADIGGQYSASNNASCGPLPNDDPGTDPANFTNETAFLRIHDIVTNPNLSTVLRGAAGLYFDQGASRNIAHHNLVYRTSQESFFVHAPDHGSSNVAAQYAPNYNYVRNSIFALAGTAQNLGVNRVLNKGGQSTSSFKIDSTIFWFNSSYTQPQANPGQWWSYDYSQLPITNGGTGYSNVFNVTFSGGGCSTAAAAKAVAVAGVVTKVNLTISGLGCSSPPTPDFSAGGGSGAAVTVTLSGGGVAVGPPVLTSPYSLFGLGFNDWWDVKNIPPVFVVNNGTSSPNNPLTYKTKVWGYDNSEGVGSIQIDPSFVNPVWPFDNFHPTVDLSAISFEIWPYELAGRTNPVISIPVVPNTFIPRTISAVTDYLPVGFTSTAKTVIGLSGATGSTIYGAIAGGGGGGGGNNNGNLYVTLGDVVSYPGGATNDGIATLPTSLYYTGLDGTPSPGTLRIVTDKASWDAQWAAAACGDILQQPEGTNITATVVGGLPIPTKTCDAAHYITYRTSGYASLPVEGVRVTPCSAGVASLPGRPAYFCPAPVNHMAKLTAAAIINAKTITFAPNMDHIRFIGIEIARADGGGGQVSKLPTYGPLIELSQTDPASDKHIIFDRTWVHGNETDETARGITLQRSSSVAIIDSYWNNFWLLSVIGQAGTDAQAINGGSNNNCADTDGTYKIVNNFLESSGENVFSGGGAACITPTNFEVRLNHLFKPQKWNPIDPTYDGGHGTVPFPTPLKPILVKNLFELKNADKVLVEANLMENNWAGFSQVGPAILLTPKNQSGLCPLCSVTNVTVRLNKVSTVAQALQIVNVQNDTGLLAKAGHTYSVHDNLFDNLLYSTCYLCTTGTSTITNFNYVNITPSFILNNVFEDHNTFVYASPGLGTVVAFLGLSGAKIATGLNQFNMGITNNVFLKGSQGATNSIGGGDTTNCANGFVSNPLGMINSCWAPYTFGGNCIINNGTTSWPGTNLFETSATAAFVNYNAGFNGDYHIAPTSTCHVLGTDGRYPGADIDAINAAIAGVQ